MFDYIREFQTLAEHLNFTSAARELGLSQSGLSRHMAALEHDLGFELLTRSPVRLTPAGARYLERVGGILDAHDQLVRECAALSKNQTPALRIAMAESSGQPACMAYAILASMHESDEGFSYELVVDRAKTVEQLVQESAADVALAYCAPGDGIDEGPAAASSPWEAPMADVAYDFMYNEPLSAWVHEDNPVFEGDATLEDLAACKLPISSNRMFKTWTDGICALFERNGCKPKTLTKDASALNEFLVALKEDEVVFTSSFLRYMVPGTNPSACEVALASGTTLVGPVYLAYRKSDDNPVLKRFVLLYRREAQKHQAQVRWSMQG